MAPIRYAAVVREVPLSMRTCVVEVTEKKVLNGLVTQVQSLRTRHLEQSVGASRFSVEGSAIDKSDTCLGSCR